jgi:hypothetical protein
LVYVPMNGPVGADRIFEPRLLIMGTRTIHSGMIEET